MQWLKKLLGKGDNDASSEETSMPEAEAPQVDSNENQGM